MTAPVPALRLMIFIGEDDLWHGRPLYTEIVHRAHRGGLAGATVLRGLEGYGASRHVRTNRLLSLSEELPVVVVIVDRAEPVRAFLSELDEVVGQGLITIEPVETVRYGGRAAGR